MLYNILALKLIMCHFCIEYVYSAMYGTGALLLFERGKFIRLLIAW